MEVSSEAISRIYFEDILFRALDRCRQADESQNLGWFSSAVMALYKALTPELKTKIEQEYQNIKQKVLYDTVEKNKVKTQINHPLAQNVYDNVRTAEIEREGTDALYSLVQGILDKEKLLLKRREIEIRRL